METGDNDFGWAVNIIIVLVLAGLTAGLAIALNQPWWIGPLYIVLFLGFIGLMDLFFNKLGG